MKHTVAFLAGLLVAAPLLGAAVEGRTITLEPDEWQACLAEGGCSLITKSALERLRKADDCRSKI